MASRTYAPVGRYRCNERPEVEMIVISNRHRRRVRRFECRAGAGRSPPMSLMMMGVHNTRSAIMSDRQRWTRATTRAEASIMPCRSIVLAGDEMVPDSRADDEGKRRRWSSELFRASGASAKSGHSAAGSTAV
jgi:hypothetical protein